MVKAMSSSIEILKSGRYIAKSTCITDPTDKRYCQDPTHFDWFKQHWDVVAHYHLSYLGVMTIRAHNELGADIRAKQQIYEGLTKVYLQQTKRLMDLETLLKEVS